MWGSAWAIPSGGPGLGGEKWWCALKKFRNHERERGQDWDWDSHYLEGGCISSHSTAGTSWTGWWGCLNLSSRRSTREEELPGGQCNTEFTTILGRFNRIKTVVPDLHSVVFNPGIIHTPYRLIFYRMHCTPWRKVWISGYL